MSLRLALKRSLEDSPSPAPENSGGKQLANNEHMIAKHTVQLPVISQCIRNANPTEIDTHGFVEVSNILSRQLLGQIKQEADIKLSTRQHQNSQVQEISNSLQLSVSDGLLREITRQVHQSKDAASTMSTVYGQHGPSNTSNYNGYVIEHPKVLVTLPGNHPQLPHADDYCTSCIVCLIHLKDGQEPTRIVKYYPRDYPTGITATCDVCSRDEQLSDVDFRRGVHLTTESWTCDCSRPHEKYNFEDKLVKSFGELIGDDGPTLCNWYCGKKDTSAGDGYLVLPTLIHRGPGNASSSETPRYMLFFTLRPTYKNMLPNATVRIYDPDQQVHASCVLYNQVKKVKSIYEENGCNLSGGAYSSVRLLVGQKVATIMRENEQLKKLNKKLTRRDDENGYATLLKENDELKEQIAQLKKEKGIGAGRASCVKVSPINQSINQST
ncbi:hypothetical protein ACHAXN_009746 [Cyclotella atomus]